MSEDYIERFIEYPICNVCGKEIDLQENPVCDACSEKFGTEEEEVTS